MKKLILSVIVVVGFAVYALAYHGGGSGQEMTSADIVASSAASTSADTVESTTPTTSTNIVASSTTSSRARSSSGSSTTKSTPPTTAPRSAGKYKNGTYTGSSVNATYGNVQVQVTISGGKITGVRFLSSPGGRGESVSINNGAKPILIQEAISAQSAKVKTVSGATFTSGAFVKSLQSALNKAV